MTAPMKNRYLVLFALAAAFSVALSACRADAGTISTVSATPVPYITLIPTETQPPTLLTNTPAPTKTATVDPTLALGAARTITEGGFSIRPPVGYEANIEGPQVNVYDNNGTIILSIFGSTSNPENLTTDEILAEFAGALFNQENSEYSIESQSTIIVDEIEGQLYEISGKLVRYSIQGQAFIVMPDQNRYIFGLGIAKTGQDQNLWINKGSKVFKALIDSIEFIAPDISQALGTCTISTDDEYGYTQENAIKVGGGAFEGPSRERAYLDNLLGPNGEKVIYKRLGSFSYEDTILDEFEVTIAGKKYTLYIDEYAYTEPQAPVGFTCVSAFPFTQP